MGNTNKGNGKKGMSYYAKDCIFLFFLGLIPSLFFKGGIFAWAAICIGRYVLIKMEWKETESRYCHTKAEFEAKGYHLPDQYFDEDGNYKGIKNL